MDCTISEKEKEALALISGQLTFADNQKFKRILEAARGGDLNALTLDFAAVDFIDSAGLGMLLLLREECQNRNISLIIRSARGQVEKIFMISKFDQLFTLNH